MDPIKFSSAEMAAFPDIFEYSQNGWLTSIIAYVIDSSFRQAVGLSQWVRHQVETQFESPDPALQALADAVLNLPGYDSQVWAVRYYVQQHFNYKGDPLAWQKSEYWATALESASKMLGDCEDGAVLTYVLCRLKGIPANRLMLWAGEVQNSSTAPSGGHCCLFYKPEAYPLNFVSLDWCYYPNIKSISDRSLFSFAGKDIEEWAKPFSQGPLWSKYRSTWFAFNEEVSYSGFKPAVLTE
jgi:transglutaminase-like putative cysteine protease